MVEGTRSRAWDNCAGYSLLEVIIGLGTFAMAFTVLSTLFFFTERSHRKNSLMTTVLSLESELLSALMNRENFNDLKFQYILQDGGVFPQFPLNSMSGTTIINVPQSPRAIAEISPAVQFFERDKTTCAGFNGDDCVIRLETSMIMTAGPVSAMASGGPPEWIPVGSDAEKASRFPLYGIAYRISVDPSLEESMRNRGVEHNDPITVRDHRWPLPYQHYMVMGGQEDCEAGGFVSGIDPDTRELICVTPADMCPSKNHLAKEVVIKNGQIGIECVPWVSFICPENYVVYEINPQMFDPDRDGTRAPVPGQWDYGRCVYFGKDTHADSDTNGMQATVNGCPAEYDVTTSCNLINEYEIPCEYDDGSGTIQTQAPAKGSASMVTNDDGSLSCIKSVPEQFCPAPYVNGFWDGQVKMDITCTLKASERFRPMEIQ